MNKHLVCPQCGTTNRVPEERLGQHVACGRCGTELMAPLPVALTDPVFEKFIARTELPVLVDFWAEWCGPCRTMAPQFMQAAMQLPRVRFAKVETDANPQACARHHIRSIPTLILFVGTQEVARHTGTMAAGNLVRWVRTQLGVTA